MTKDLLRREMVKAHGPGGLNCPCCGPPPSARKQDKRILKKRVRRVLDRLAREFFE